MLAEKAVMEWQDIYYKKTGREITFEEATIAANRMIRLLGTIFKGTEQDQNCMSTKEVMKNVKN